MYSIFSILYLSTLQLSNLPPTYHSHSKYVMKMERLMVMEKRCQTKMPAKNVSVSTGNQCVLPYSAQPHHHVVWPSQYLKENVVLTSTDVVSTHYDIFQ